MKKNSITIYCVALGALSLMISTGCQEPTTPAMQPVSIDTTGVSASGTMRFEGEIISIPSPVLIAAVLQKNNIQFKQELLNQLQNKNKYVNETKKALNLGVYGSDLAYLSNYNLGQTTVDYFDAVASLASELEILDKVDRSIISSFQTNMDKRDSLLALNGDFFRAADLYLKSSERSHLSSYILIGGWVESMHLILDAAGQNEELRKRLAEQKYSASSIKFLASKLNDAAFAKAKVELENVCKTLEGLESSYIYQQPINDKLVKKTYLRSQTSVKLPGDKLASLKDQIATVRNLIIE
jgi:hypothetical protein